MALIWCPQCEGEGRVDGVRCKRCGGQRKVDVFPERDNFLQWLAERLGSKQAGELFDDLREDLDPLFAWLQEDRRISRTGWVLLPGRPAFRHGKNPDPGAPASVVRESQTERPDAVVLWSVQ